jgi:hypothetical protein
MFISMGITRGTNSRNHRAGLILLALLTVITLSGRAALHSQQAPPTSQLSLANASKSGVVLMGTDTLGYRVEQVHAPDSSRFVNNAVLYSNKAQIRQFNRSNENLPAALDAAIRLYNAKVGSKVGFANSRFMVKASSRTNSGGRVVVHTKLARTDSPSKMFAADFSFRFGGGLLRQVSLPEEIQPSKDAADICYYYPAECLTEFTVSYDAKRVQAAIDNAQAKYERKWLRKPGSAKAFETLMAAAARTYSDFTSWTVVSEDGSQGSIYDGKTNSGVTWGPYDPTRSFGLPRTRFQADAPDLGLVSNTFFDTTDGGSNFFYSEVNRVGAAGGYVVTNYDGTPAVEFEVRGGTLSRITSYFLDKEVVTLTGVSNRQLLKSKLAQIKATVSDN